MARFIEKDGRMYGIAESVNEAINLTRLYYNDIIQPRLYDIDKAIKGGDLSEEEGNKIKDTINKRYNDMKEHLIVRVGSGEKNVYLSDSGLVGVMQNINDEEIIEQDSFLNKK